MHRLIALMLRSLAVLAVVVCGNLAPDTALAAPGDRAKIVIMLDLTGSTSLSDLEIAKNAARQVLRVSAQASAEQRPFIAIGTFSVQEANSARILGALTDDYGSEQPASGLFAVLNSITSTGGYTDIGAAITVAQEHLVSSTIAGYNNIMLLSDGTANRPGAPNYTNCDECGCPFANSAANSAATLAEQAGTRIFGIHYAGNGVNFVCQDEPVKGQNFLRNEIATDPAYFFLGNQDLSGIFAQISQTISCDDGNACTVDAFDPVIQQCVYVPSTNDTDGDGVLDCQDTCSGNNALIGTACVDGDGACRRTGVFVCGPESRVGCASNDLVDSQACFGCAVQDTSATLEVVASAVRSQNAALGSLGRALRKALAPGKKSRAARSVALLATTRASALNVDANTALGRLPRSFQLCSNTESCQQVQFGVEITRLEQVSAEAKRIGESTWRLLRRQKKVNRTAVRKSYQTLLMSALRVTEQLPKLPRVRSSCNLS